MVLFKILPLPLRNGIGHNMNNSKLLTETDQAALKLAKTGRTLPTREETIQICARLGFYPLSVATTLLNGDVPASTLTKAERMKLEERDREMEAARNPVPPVPPNALAAALNT